MLDNKPLLSIIIPTYNSGLTVLGALKSIYNQTFKNLEVLIIDNCSIDNTKSIINDYQKKYSNIKFISEKDSGIYEAMNKGIALAKGDWVYFLGSDDTFCNDKILDKVFHKLDNRNSVNVVYGNVYFEEYKRVYDYEFNYYKLTTSNICHQSIFFKKDVFSIIGDFNTNYKVLADWDHNMRWFFSKKIKHQYINLVIANFASGGFSATQKDFVFDRIKYFKILKLVLFKLSLTQLIETCNNALKYYKAHDQTKKYICFKAFKYFFVAINKVK